MKHNFRSLILKEKPVQTSQWFVSLKVNPILVTSEVTTQQPNSFFTRHQFKDKRA